MPLFTWLQALTIDQVNIQVSLHAEELLKNNTHIENLKDVSHARHHRLTRYQLDSSDTVLGTNDSNHNT